MLSQLEKVRIPNWQNPKQTQGKVQMVITQWAVWPLEGGVSNLEKSKVYAGGQSLCLNSRSALSQKQELYSDLQPET